MSPGEPEVHPGEVRPGDVRPRRGRWWLVLPVVVLLVACGGLAGYYFLTGTGANPTAGAPPYPTTTKTAATQPALTQTPGSTTAPTGPPVTGTPPATTPATATAPPSVAVSPSLGGQGPVLSDQISYQLDILDQRAALKSGTVYSESTIRAETGHGYPVTVVICGLASTVCGPRPTASAAPSPSPSTLPSPSSSPSSSPSGLPPELGAVSIGARIKAELVSGYEEVSVSGPQAASVQPIIEATDFARWRWVVYAHEANTYTLNLSISVLQAGSDDLLIPTQTFDITLIATTTTKDRIAQVGGDVATFLTTTVLGIVTTVATLISTVGAVGNGFVRMRRRRVARIAAPPPS